MKSFRNSLFFALLLADSIFSMSAPLAQAGICGNFLTGIHAAIGKNRIMGQVALNEKQFAYQHEVAAAEALALANNDPRHPYLVRHRAEIAALLAQYPSKLELFEAGDYFLRYIEDLKTHRIHLLIKFNLAGNPNEYDYWDIHDASNYFVISIDRQPVETFRRWNWSLTIFGGQFAFDVTPGFFRDETGLIYEVDGRWGIFSIEKPSPPPRLPALLR